MPAPPHGLARALLPTNEELVSCAAEPTYPALISAVVLAPNNRRRLVAVLRLLALRPQGPHTVSEPGLIHRGATYGGRADALMNASVGESWRCGEHEGKKGDQDFGHNSSSIYLIVQNSSRASSERLTLIAPQLQVAGPLGRQFC